MTQTPTDVVTVGEAMALLLADGLVPLRRATEFTRSVAGSESNVAIGLARLGHHVAFVGRVGDDAAGDWVTETLRAAGVDTAGLLRDNSRSTGLLLRDRVVGRPVGVNYYRTGSAGSALQPSDIDSAMRTGPSVVMVSGITCMLSPSASLTVDHLLDAAEKSGAHVVFDVNVRLRLAQADAWRRCVDRVVGRVDTFLAGEDELALLGHHSAAELLTGRTKAAVVRRGARGAVVTTSSGEQFEQPGRTVPVVDPVGAGDAFTVGWISARIRGLSMADALNEALTLASVVVATPTDICGLPTAAERDQLTRREEPDVDR